MYPQYRHLANQGETSVQEKNEYFLIVGEIAGIVEKYSILLFVILTMIWLTGRIIGTFSGNIIFDPQFIRWAAIVVKILLFVLILSMGTGYIKPFSENYRQWPLIFPWFFFVALIILVCFSIQGYYTASSGLFSIFAEWTESMRQSVFLMFKSFRFSPMLPVNLTALIASGAKIETEYVAPFLLGYPYVLAFFVWSLLYGSMLFIFHGPRRAKIIHLIAALTGLLLLMAFKSISMITDDFMIIMHMGIVILILCQILITYSSLRAFIKNIKSNEIKEIDRCLPPKAWALCLILLIFLPALADLDNQKSLASASIRLIEMNRKFNAVNNNVQQYKVTAEISARTGPAIGDDFVAVLPKGSIISVQEEKNGWVRFDDNLWVSSRFLSPIKRDWHQEKAVIP